LTKVGVISDTHLRAPDGNLDYIIDNVLGRADMILHAGDIVGRATLDHLELKGVIAVCGNMDDYEVASHLPQTRIIPVEKIRIGLTHGWGAKQGLEQRIIERFSDDLPEIIVYGHSHKPFWGEIDGVWLFNPGSAATGHYGAGGAVGLLEIDGTRFDGSIIQIQ
jgi:hypothetical protein